MLERLKRIARRLLSSPGGPPWTNPPEIPDAGVRQPRSRRPSGGAAAVALAEPDDGPQRVEAVGTGGRSRGVFPGA